ncbi:unnamed protein product (macronuclear) [Paramecium tetraurelia]|uniref:RING-type domain-containing protein n=1 Tax=Paramecium tetraurelia TaxID=5888 RepID=A0BFW0_PARTE|nr:uncharacterized protein GSPATT00028462001 [Paramecium tetraurelia]CAK57427.1 unnamed protein product [Paramecium tetraurelia]|eukprot:XP_001424825.1 hypothetical protein (macronuclear) [Paramecium tetraurelia strain d4-2]
MRRSSRFQQQDSNQRDSEPGQRLQTQASLQQNKWNSRIRYLLYCVMLLILATLIISIIAIIKNNEQQQVVYLGILLILLLTTLFGCMMYIKQQFSQLQTNNIRIQNEIQMNDWVYLSASYILFQFTTQSKFTLIRLTYLYCVVAIFLLTRNIQDKTYYACQDSKNDRPYETDHLDENQYYDDCVRDKIPAKFQGPMLYELGISCEIVFFTIIIYEGLSISQRIYLACQQCIWPSYQHDPQNQNIAQVTIQIIVFCFILLFNNLGKFIALLVIIILTPNASSYILISSNLFYHFFMIIFTLSLLYLFSAGNIISQIFIENSYQNIRLLQFIDYQVLIDQILRRSNQQNKLFKLFLITSLIFTIVGISEFSNEMEKDDVIINYDIFLEYECGITQLIFLGLMLLKYLIIPFFTDQYTSNMIQVNQEGQIQNRQNQQIDVQQQQPHQRVNVDPINNVQNNLPQLIPIQNVNKNFIFKVELKEKSDCTICLQQLTYNSQQNPIVQLKCHVSHIFHQQCIQNWLNYTKKCPICNTEFS